MVIFFFFCFTIVFITVVNLWNGYRRWVLTMQLLGACICEYICSLPKSIKIGNGSRLLKHHMMMRTSVWYVEFLHACSHILHNHAYLHHLEACCEGVCKRAAWVAPFAAGSSSESAQLDRCGDSRGQFPEHCAQLVFCFFWQSQERSLWPATTWGKLSYSKATNILVHLGFTPLSLKFKIKAKVEMPRSGEGEVWGVTKLRGPNDVSF